MNTSKQWEIALRVIETIERAGYEAYIVGGAVRDYLLNKEVNDVDIATSALPEEVKEIFSSTVDVGIEHGTILVLDEGQPIEVTTYRTEGTYTDYRRPDEVSFVTNVEEDLKRRDFTMNAMAMSKDGELLDLFGGKEDVENRVIRAVGNPNTRFREDALRMLRAIRFSAQLGFTIEEQTMEAIRQDSDLIEFIAKERIHAEFSKLWVSDNVYIGIQSLCESDLATYLKGDFELHLESWKPFLAEQSQIGWAYLCLLNRKDYQGIINDYKLSNKEKNFIKSVFYAYDTLLKHWTEIDYFSNPIVVLEAAYTFAQWQNKNVPFSKEHIALVKDNLPIQTLHELAINGNHLMEWTEAKRGGPWVKEALDNALLVVLSGEVKNEEELLKEWFLNEFIDER